MKKNKTSAPRSQASKLSKPVVKKVKPAPLFPSLASENTASKSHSPKSKTSPTAYYNCLLNFANQDWHHPVTGQKKKITACCRECKLNAPALNSEKDKELVKLITSYKQVGDSLAKLLRPIK